jgi:hypothetical protein
MKKKIHIGFLLILFFLNLLTGCNSKEKENPQESLNTNSLESITIDVTNIKETNKPFTLSQFVESISYIRLDDDPILKDAFRSRPKILNDTIYIDCFDGNGFIYKYTPEGKFIKQIFTKGVGPGEIIRASALPAAFNEGKREITVNDYNNNTNIIYSFDGAFIEKKGSSNHKSQTKKIHAYLKDIHVYCIEDYSFSNEKANALGPYLFYVADANDSIVYAYPNTSFEEKSLFTGKYAEIMPGPMSFISIDSSLWFKHFYIDTLYSTSDFKTIYPRYIFKTDDTFMNLSQYAQRIFGQLQTDPEQLKQMIGVLPLPTGDLLFILKDKSKFLVVLADTTGKIISCAEKLVSNDLDHYLKNINLLEYIGSRVFCIRDNYMYIPVNAFEFFNEGCEPPFKDLTEDSNPVILKLELKTN